MRDVRVAAVQFEHAAGNKESNFTKITHFVKKAARQNVEIIVFPEWNYESIRIFQHGKSSGQIKITIDL